ncbi:MAG: hypothetical protein HQK75_05560 [Candidatus Magnetomorum sp.]|nr:hypothetical protein [Candidatus Magnetomorum sp.]
MQKFFAIIYFYVFLLIAFMISAQADTTLSISGPTHVEIGETFITTIDISDAQDLLGFDIRFKFDPANIICANDNIPGDFNFDFEAADITDCNNGSIQYAQVSYSPKNGNGCLFSISWNALAEGVATIRFYRGELSDSSANSIIFLPPYPFKIIAGNPFIPPTISLIAPEQVKVNDVFTTFVMISGAKDCSGIQFSFNVIPKDIICAKKNISGRFISGIEVDNVVDCENGYIQYAEASFTPKNGDGTLFTTDWIAQKEGTVSIELADGVLSDSNGEAITYVYSPDNNQITVEKSTQFDVNADGSIDLKDLIELLHIVTGIE